jgi:hypothetical protein
VAPLPDTQSRWSNPDLKVYATEILVTDTLPDVKPGVSARAEIVITNLPNVLTVPLQAVTTRNGKQVVFLASAPDQPVSVNIGMYNTKFIEITSGLKEGAQVLLAPPFDTKEKDLAGAIIAEGETLPPNATNQTLAHPQDRNGVAESGGSQTELQQRLKRFDTNGDGRLDETELAAMREQLRREQGGGAPPARPVPN